MYLFQIDAGKATITSGTNDFVPPEVFPSIKLKQERDFNYYTDSFSFGCLVLFVFTHDWPVLLVKTISHPEIRKPHTCTEIERRQNFLDDLTEAEKMFEPLILACLKEEPPTDWPNFCNIHDRQMPEMAVFTDANISRRLFSRFALGNSSKADQPTLVTQEEHVHSEHHQLSVSQGWVWGWLVFLLISMVAAYVVGGLLRSDSSI